MGFVMVVIGKWSKVVVSVLELSFPILLRLCQPARYPIRFYAQFALLCLSSNNLIHFHFIVIISVSVSIPEEICVLFPHNLLTNKRPERPYPALRYSEKG